MHMMAMNQDEFTAFRNRSINNFSEQLIEDLHCTPEVAYVKAEQKLNSYLSDGLETAGHYFYHIKDNQGEAHGYLWFGEREENNYKKIFIYDIFVEEVDRGQGYGKSMLIWLENETKKLDLLEISLHVLGYNHIARELYESMGFEITNIYMAKKLV